MDSPESTSTDGLVTEAVATKLELSQPTTAAAMYSYVATKTVFSRIQTLDPENAAKIMGYLLIQDHGEEEMIRLAFGPETLLLSLINQAKTHLGIGGCSPESKVNNGFDECLIMKAIQQKRFEAEASLLEMGRGPFPYNKCMNFGNDSPRSASAALVMGEEFHSFGRHLSERSDLSVMGFEGSADSVSRQIYLTFLADSTFLEEDVSNYFSKFGPVQDVRIPYQQKRMFGFVSFVSPETVNIILAKGNLHFVCDSGVFVKPYKEKGKVPDKNHRQRQLERGGSFDSLEPYDLPFGPRMFLNSKEMLRGKLEQVELQQAIELQGRRTMNFQLSELKNHHHGHQFQPNRIPGIPIPSPAPPHLRINQSHLLRSNSFNQEILEQKPSADFDATTNRACQSDILVSSSEEKNMRDASRRQCMLGGVLNLVDSGATRISSTDFDAPDNSAHLVRAYQSGPIVFNSEKEDTGEFLNRECFTKSILSLDDSSVPKSLSDVDVTENKSHLVRAYQSGSFMSLSDNKNRGEALKRKCITKIILGLEDLQQISRDRCDDAAKSFCVYDPGIHTTYSLAPVSFEVLEMLPTREQPNDRVPLLSLGRLTLEDCVQQEKSPDLPRVTQINGAEQRVTKVPRYLGGLTPQSASSALTSHTLQSASSSRWPIGLPDGGHIDLLDPLVQYTTNIEHAVRADQCSPTESRAEKKMARKTLKRMCRTMSVIFEENHRHFARRCKGAAKSLGAMRIFRKHGINQVSPVKQIHKQHRIRQWPFRQKWATRKGYSLGDERPFKVSSLYMDEKLDSRLQFIHMSKFAGSSPRALTLPDGGDIVGPVALSLSEFAATNNRAHLVEQDQSGSTASHYECKNTRETSDKQGLEDLKRHFGCKDKDAVKSLGVSVSMFKSTCGQHWVYCWPGQFENNEQQAFDATNDRAHLVKADESGPTVSNSGKGSTREALKRDCLTNALSLEDLRQHFGARRKDAAEGLYDSPAWKSFEVLDSLPLGERSNNIRHLARRRTLTHKHRVRLKKSQDLLRSLQRDCSGGLAPQSDIGLPDGGHILSLSEKKVVRKTLKRKCRTMSVLSLEDHQQHVGRRWEDMVKFLCTKRICRQLVIHRETTAQRIRRQLGTRRCLFKQSAIGLPDGGHILHLPEKKIVRKTLKRKCRSISVLSLEDHKQHVDRRWEDAAKSHGTKRIRRQLVIRRLSSAKRTHKQQGIHQWPFRRSAIGLPDRGHILSLSEKKIVRKTLKRKCRSMSVLSLADRQQHVDRRWEDAAKNIGAKRICRQLVIHRVSIAKRICWQHGIHHRWPFERDWATKNGYSLGEERPVEVISLSTHAELVLRLQLIYISWLGRFSPRPSALPRGGLIVGPIALSSSEFAATNNLAQRVGHDQRGSGASGSENERTREQEDPKEIRTSITKDDLLQLHGRMTRKDAAAILNVSVSTVKRKCQEYKIGPWKNGGRKRVWRPPDQHGEGNTSTARETPSHNVQTGMEGEPIGQNQEANECRRDFMERQIALNTESGLIMVSRPPEQHGERNTSTARETPSHNVQTGIEGVPVGQNQEANEFRRDFTEGSIPLNTENGLRIGSSFGWASQVNDQSILSTPYPNHDALVFPPPQITSMPSENRGASIDLRNSLASQAEPFSDRHISGFSNLTFARCSDQAAPSQHVGGQAMQSTDHNAFVFPQTQMVSPQEPFPAGHVFEFSNRNKHANSVKIKAFYGEDIYKFLFPFTSGIDDLKKEVSRRLNVEVDRFEVKYMDEYGHLISLPCDEDWMLCLSSSQGSDEIRVFVFDKVGGTPNFRERCRSSTQTRA